MNKNKIKKAISFHSSIKRAKDFRELIKFSNLAEEEKSEVIPFHISGKDGPGERSKIINQFLNETHSIITNARCLTEGVDIPQIDAILFADPKKSLVDIVQASGRAFRKYDGKEFGYIIIPLLLDDNGNPIDDSFNQIREIICSLGTIDERIVDDIKSLIIGNNHSKKYGQEGPIDYKFFESTSMDLNQLYKDISIKLWDRLSFSVSSISDSKFSNWLSESSNVSDVTRKKYLSAIRKISNDLIKQNIYYGSLEDLMADNPEKIIKEYFDKPENKEMDDRGHHMYSAAAKKLTEFYKSQNISNSTQ